MNNGAHQRCWFYLLLRIKIQNLNALGAPNLRLAATYSRLGALIFSKKKILSVPLPHSAVWLGSVCNPALSFSNTFSPLPAYSPFYIKIVLKLLSHFFCIQRGFCSRTLSERQKVGNFCIVPP